MPHKNSPRQQTPSKNIFKDCSNRTGYYSAEGAAFNQTAENRLQATLGSNKSSNDWIVGDTKEVLVKKIKIAEFHESREFRSNNVKTIFTETGEVFYESSKPGGETTSQAGCKLRRIIKSYAS